MLGGVDIYGLSDTDAEPMLLTGLFGADPTDTTPAITFRGGQKNGTSWQALSATETVFQFRNYTTNLATILGNGNVGIGMTNPRSKLEINPGAGKSSLGVISNSALHLYNAGDVIGDIAQISFGGYTQTNAAAYIAYQNKGNASYGMGDLYFATRSVETDTVPTIAMTIYRNGNVGIGTTAPTQKLTVSGSINVVGGSFIDDGTTLTVPDYVFEPEYNLRSIPELEAYLAQNFHLPGVLSREQVKSNGMNYGNMMMSILEKTEENTLYVINNYKDIQNQQAEIGEITDQISALSSSFYITNSEGDVILSRSREIGASQNREMTISANTISLDGNVGIGTTSPTEKLTVLGNINLVGGSFIADGINLNSMVDSIADNQNKITEQLTGILADQNLTVTEKLRIIGENLDNLNSEQYDKQIETIKEQIEKNTLKISVLGNQLDVISEFLTISDGTFDLKKGILKAAGIEAGSVVAGAFAVKVVDEDTKTVGQAVIVPVMDIVDANADGLDDATLSKEGKIVVVKTKAVSANSKVFVTANKPVKIGVTQITAGESFTVEVGEEVSEDLVISWWIVEEK